MPLDAETKRHLLRIKEDIEEILGEVGDILPPDFRMTCVLRYCGTNEDVDDMIWTDDVHDDVIGAIEKKRDEENAS